MHKLLLFMMITVHLSAHAENRLKDKVVIITGASQGIGKGIAEIFAKEGAKIVIVSRTETKLKSVVDEISKNGGKISYIVGDITNPNEMKIVVNKTVKQYGRIDILIHNAAGIYPFEKVEDMSYETWRKALNTNLDAVFLVIKSVLPYMKKQKYGRIVFTSSISGPRVGLPGKAHYTASKAGLTGFMKTLAIEIAKYGITVNAVEPGNIKTEGLLTKNSSKSIKQRINLIPIGRLGTIYEIAYAHLFLATDEAKYITGQSIIVDGGQTLPESPYGF